MEENGGGSETRSLDAKSDVSSAATRAHQQREDEFRQGCGVEFKHRDIPGSRN